MWQKEARDYIKTKRLINQSVTRTYYLVWGKCDDTIHARLKEAKIYATIKKGFMMIDILKEIKLIAFHVQIHQYLLVCVYKTLQTFMMSRQGKHTSIQQ